MNYLEKESKILNVNVEELIEKLKSLGAVEVFNDNRVITHFDTKEGTYMGESKVIKITEEGKVKLSYSGKTSEGKEDIKLTVSRKEEAVDFLNRIGLFPISESKSHRISFEWEGVDFDIDTFPQIPPFLEIDLGNSSHTLEDISEKLELQKNEIAEMGTPAIYGKYQLDYFEIFKLSSLFGK